MQKIEFKGHIYYVNNTLPYDKTKDYVWYGNGVASCRAHTKDGGLSYREYYEQGFIHRVIATTNPKYNLPTF